VPLHKCVTRCIVFVLLTANLFVRDLTASDAPEKALYFWKTTPVRQEAEIITLFVPAMHSDGLPSQPASVPLVAILRDSLGDPKHATDRLRYVWLLSSSRPTLKQELLSAVPFFHSPVSRRGSDATQLPKPLLDLAHPQHSIKHDVLREAIKRAATQLSVIGLGALPKPYFSNHADHARLNVEAALSVLRRAPTSEQNEAVSETELETIVVRLMLSKGRFGELASNTDLSTIAQSNDVRREAARLRNMELLRTSAERLGLYFEPLNLANKARAAASARYGLLWLPLHSSYKSPGAPLNKTWQLLQIANPSHDAHLTRILAYRQARTLDENGQLLSVGQTGPSKVDVVPVALYSLTYPRAPVLLVDFLHPSRIHHRELNQRLLSDLSASSVYFSPVPAWGFASAMALYRFVRGHQGVPTNQQERFDCYAQARMDLSLDGSLDADFRSHAQTLLNEMSVNPLDAAVDHDIAAANRSYRLLMQAAAAPEELLNKLDKDRRQELAAFGTSRKAQFTARLWHYSTFGVYTRRVPASSSTIESTRSTRRIEDLLSLLAQVTRGGARPEVAFDTAKVESTVEDLSVLTRTSPAPVRESFLGLTHKLLGLSQDEDIRTRCRAVLENEQNAPKIVASQAGAIATADIRSAP
jgi:hypothetical protein